ncbi:hypothetical protein M8494_12775 [Serratia ureilytica]
MRMIPAALRQYQNFAGKTDDLAGSVRSTPRCAPFRTTLPSPWMQPAPPELPWRQRRQIIRAYWA